MELKTERLITFHPYRGAMVNQLPAGEHHPRLAATIEKLREESGATGCSGAISTATSDPTGDRDHQEVLRFLQAATSTVPVAVSNIRK
jgi:hypothetical protein